MPSDTLTIDGQVGDVKDLTLAEETQPMRAMLPSVQAFARMTDAAMSDLKWSMDRFNEEMKKADLTEMAKALNVPPSALTFGRISYMPDPSSGNLLPWPGVSPASLKKICNENVPPKLVIEMRVDDVMRYSALSNHPWKPGWHIELMEGKKAPSEAEMKEIRKAEQFLLNNNIEYDSANARERDEHRITDFMRFTNKITRDSLQLDGIAIWTDCDDRGRVRAFAPLPAANIRLATERGYMGDKSKFAVLVDETEAPVTSYTRQELIWYTRNMRLDPEVGNYGWSEVEMSMKIIQGFQNALDLNIDTFSRSGVPNGMMLLKGSIWTQNQLDLFTREWNNMKRGISKAWGLPVVVVPGGKDSDIEIKSLKDIKGEDVRYQDHMNMMAGALCTLYRFPVRRLGYRISGKGPDTVPLQDSQMKLIDEDDPGLSPLLMHIENIVNSYLLWTRWPYLRFVYTGKNPKEDTREYEARKLSRTWGESRAETDLPTLVSIAPKEFKEFAALLEMVPEDPAKIGAFQSIIDAWMKATGKEGGELPNLANGGGSSSIKQPGAPQEKQKDPARSQSHGHPGGVRRDSRAEKHKPG